MVLDLFRLDGKIALVTGASAGLGAAIARALAEAGADVACHGNSRDLEPVCGYARQVGRRAAPVRGDLAHPGAARHVFEQAMEAFGRVDILVNNAGIVRRSAAVDCSDADWDSVLQVNLTSVFQLAQAAGRQMLPRGHGKIVNIASLLSFQGGIRVAAYAAAKGAVAQLTKALANEWAAAGINVNAIAPGYMDTTATEALRHDPERNRQILERIPAGRWGEPADLAGAAVYLCSPASDYVNGHVLVVDGGWMGR